MRAKDALGRFGEELAADYLRRSGLVVLERNYRCRIGEIDIVARDGDVLVICEVKTRSTEGFGNPIQAITPIKLRRLHRLAFEWIRERGVHPAAIRIDAIGILQPRNDEPILEHLRDVA
jgi:putative endonuclease